MFSSLNEVFEMQEVHARLTLLLCLRSFHCWRKPYY